MTPRWHAGTSAPWLARSGDTTGAHGARMAILAKLTWPNASPALIWACIAHDLGEYATGDLPLTAKANPNLKAELEKQEEQARIAMGININQNKLNSISLEYLDRLDAYLWASHHAPHLMQRPDWQQAREWLKTKSIELNAKIPTE
jgi:hypothetical protein